MISRIVFPTAGAPKPIIKPDERPVPDFFHPVHKIGLQVMGTRSGDACLRTIVTNRLRDTRDGLIPVLY